MIIMTKNKKDAKKIKMIKMIKRFNIKKDKF